MTPPEVDQELERLLVATRAATLPTSGARERVRAAVSARLASPGPGLTRRSWLPWVVVGLVGLGAASFLTYRGGLVPAAKSPSAAPAGAPLARPSAVSAEQPATVASASVSAEPLPAALPSDSKPSLIGKPTVRSPVVPSASAAPPSASVDAGDELSLVRSMQAALRAGDAGQTLKLASEHARRFPSGALVEEREGLRAVARCQGAPTDARAAILAGFLKAFGGSPYAARVKAVCQ